MLAPGAVSTDIHMNARHSYCILEVTQKKKKSWNSTKARRDARGWGGVWGYGVLVSQGGGVKLHLSL